MASVLALVILMLLSSIAVSAPSAAQAVTVPVPNIVGMPEADANAAIVGALLVVGTPGSAYDATVPLRHVISVDPPAGTPVAQGSTVTYILSAGPPPQSQQPTPTPSPTPTPKPPKPKPTPWPTPPGIKGVDVSHWNGAPDFYVLRGHGMEFVFSKASQGTWFQDETFLRNTQVARAAGLVAGAYHFFDYRKAGKKQAQHFLNTLQQTTGLAGLMPLVVDVETLRSLGTPNQAAAKARLHALLDELYRRTGRYPMIYTSREMWMRVVGNSTEFGAYPLWVACWKCDDIHIPSGWGDWRFWQVGQFRFPNGPRLDGNTYRLTRKRLQREKQRDMRVNGGAEWALQTSVSADLRGYDGTEVRVALDGGGFGPWAPYQQPYQVQLGNAQGPRRVILQLRSFRGVTSPLISDDIALDSVPPKVKGPKVSLASGSRLPKDGKRVPVSASVKASDKTSGLDWSKVEASCGSKVARKTRKRQAWIASVDANIRRTGCTVTGIAADVAGHTASKSLRPRVKLLDVRKRSKSVSLKGAWKTTRSKAALGKTLAIGSGKGAKARIRFKGSQFAIVARRGPSGGQLQVRVDGKRVTTISLYASENDNRRVVHVGNVRSRKRSHVLELRTTGRAEPAAAGATVWLDAILVLDRRS